ncbi:Serine/threonine-protein kinase D1 [Oopsacas minuta]|uniref:Serine/threonine-protein kinase D1 n=1 Tax=Oopsacas minuta TaxID=111878 RepID=A0AAV7K937_9METZ|nr:Serine/threonine-protein kinase D1 [Oopsacas minuta]
MTSKSFVKQNVPKIVGVDAEYVDISIQFGLWRDILTLSSYELSQISLHSFKLKTCELLSLRYPEHDIKDMFACTLFFVHFPDDTLEPLKNPSLLKEDLLIDVLLGVSYQPSTSQHEFRVHSYKKTTFCDYCGYMLAGLTKQGMKCSACGLNLHKKCVYDSTPFCSKVRHNQSLHDTTNIIASSHSHVAQARNASGRATHFNTGGGHYRSSSNVIVPHTFIFHKFIAPTQCDLCGRTVKGIFKQGMQCKDCDLCCHRKCMKKAINSCPGETSKKTTRIGRHSMVLKYPGGRGGQKWSDGVSGEVELPSTDDTDSAHSEPASPAKKMSNYNIDKNTSSIELRRNVNEMDKFDRPQRGRKESDRNDPASLDDSINPNIPLQRIFVRVNPDAIGAPTSILKEGWMVNCNENDHQRVRCYLRLDRRSLCMFTNSDIPTPFKQIFLADMRAVDQVASINMDKLTPPHCFELVTKEITYYMGMEIPENGKARNKMMKTLQRNNPVYQWLQEALEMNTEELHEYGLGLDIAISWESALHHSLMPVTPEGSTTNINEIGLDDGQISTDLDMVIKPEFPTIKHLSTRSSLSDDDEVIRYADEPRSPCRTSMRNRPRSIKSRKGSTRGSFRVPRPEDDVVHNLVIDRAVETKMDISLIYQIFGGEVLGSGQFGTVHEGVHRSTGEPVAIKVIDKQRFQPKHTEALKNEANILQSVSHNGIIKLYKMFESPTRIFVIMEKMQWDMLEMILNSVSGRLTEGVTKFVIYQILVAIQFLHSKNIVHCDLKPENVLLSSKFTEYPQIKLCDFGFAKTIRDAHFRKSVVGTPAYLAPEVLTKTGYDKSLDMWSLGVVIYVSLSGTFPFNEDEAIIDQINNADFMYPPYPWKTIDIEARHVINKFLRINKRERLTANKALLQPWLQDRDMWERLREIERQVGERYLTHPTDDKYWSSLPKTRGVSESSYTQASEDSSETSEDLTQPRLMDLPLNGSNRHPDSGYSQSAGYSSDGSILDGSKHKKNNGSAFDPIDNSKMLKVTTV